jgi:citrate lyase subunit beta/citryl-CoA lyase
MINKALSLDADSIIFDLEDSVSLQEKEKARKIVVESILSAKQTGKEVLVRVNVTNSFFGIQDILAIVPEGPDALIIPKADEKAIIIADTMIGAIEESLGWQANTVRLVPLLETSYSIMNANKILGTSSRINGVQLGAEDLTKELDIVRTRNGDELWFARSMIVFAGRALGIDVIDSPFTDIGDVEGLIADACRVKALGMTGKTCIHPSQISTINEIFTPKPEDVEYARKVVKALEISVKEGKGACSLDGKMIDNPVAERAQKIIKKAEMIGI